MIEILIIPTWRQSGSRRNDEAFVLRVRDLRGAKVERINPDSVNRPFAILTGGGSHEEPGPWDEDEARFNGRRIAGLLEVRMSGCHATDVQPLPVSSGPSKSFSSSGRGKDLLAT